MGLFDGLLGPGAIEKAVDGYFGYSRSKYESFRLCIRDMIAVKMQNGTTSQQEMHKITETLLNTYGKYGQIPRIEDHVIMRSLVVVSLIRCPLPCSANIIYFENKPSLWVDSGVALIKPERELRFSLLDGPNNSWAWISLYDDGSRISPLIPGVDDITGWKTIMNG